MTQDHKPEETKQSLSSPVREPLILHGFTCPITQELMQKPVMTADGISYEEIAIKTWFARGKRTSPATGLPLSHQLLIPSINLKQAIEDFLKHEPEFAKIKELEHATKTQGQMMIDLQLAIKLREEELEAQRTKHETLSDEKHSHSPATLLSQRGLLSENPQKVEQRLGKAVLTLVDALNQHLPLIREHNFDANAASGFASALVNALRKQKSDAQSLTRLLKSPEEGAVPSPVAHFLSNYLAQNPLLHEITEHPAFAKSLEVTLGKNSIGTLRDRYGQEGTVSAGTAANSSSSTSSSSSSSFNSNSGSSLSSSSTS